MKFLIIGMLVVGPKAWGARNPLSDVPKNILAEERLQAANDFAANFEAECDAATLSTEDCNQLRAFTKTQKYNAKLNLYGHMEQFADKRALARQSEIDCVGRYRKLFTVKRYALPSTETCDNYAAALLILEPPMEL